MLIRPLLPCPSCTATIEERAVVTNVTGRTLTVALRGSYGGVQLDFGSQRLAPGASWTATAQVAIHHPALWAPGHPSLYRARLTLLDPNGRPLGGCTWLSGIRLIQRTRHGRLTLNGHPLDLRGVSLHQQNIDSGGALNMRQMSQMMRWVRGLGATIIRAHYPLNPELEQLADQAGVLVWSEIPAWRVAPQYYVQPSWRSAALSVLAADIAANQNHPSIMLWSIGNELTTPAGSGEAAHISSASSLARSLDPTRPVGMAVSAWPGIPCEPAYSPLDVIGVNEYFGWFDAGGGTTDDRDALSPFLDFERACYPNKALMVTEFGFDGNRNGPVEAYGTYQFQDAQLQFHLGVFDSKPWLSGAIYFILQDFAARPGYAGGNPLGEPPFVTNGLVDLFGHPKTAYTIVQQAYRGTTQIAP